MYHGGRLGGNDGGITRGDRGRDERTRVKAVGQRTDRVSGACIALIFDRGRSQILGRRSWDATRKGEMKLDEILL
jgi:hypothetical protein